MLHAHHGDSREHCGTYSTDPNGHCFLYGPKIAGLRTGNGKFADPRTIDVGEWRPTKKYHLRANQEAPVNMTFDAYTADVAYPYHVARFPPRGKSRSRSPSPTRCVGGVRSGHKQAPTVGRLEGTTACHYLHATACHRQPRQEGVSHVKPRGGGWRCHVLPSPSLASC